MASIPLTLAALATSAVPGLVVHGARGHSGGGEGAFTSAVLVTDDGELIVRIPRTQAAETQQSAELLGFAALTDGARSQLPFLVPQALGMSRAGDTRAVVTTFLPGGRIDAADVEAEALLLQPVAEALAAIHDLPHSIVHRGGLPARSAEDVRVQLSRLVDRAVATRLLPRTVHNRWSDALSNSELWDFAPTVIHGSFDAEQLLVADDQIVGVLGWSELSLGDPAADMSWLLAAGDDVLDSVLARYASLRDAGHLGRLRARAGFHHELDVARWLLHGVDSHDEAVVDDAVDMLDRLVDHRGSVGFPVPGRAALTDEQVSQLLDEVPQVHDHLSDTAAYEALDEDRVFRADTDFIEPLGEGSDDEAGSGTDSSSASVEADDESARRRDQETQPVDPLAPENDTTPPRD